MCCSWFVFHLNIEIDYIEVFSFKQIKNIQHSGRALLFGCKVRLDDLCNDTTMYSGRTSIPFFHAAAECYGSQTMACQKLDCAWKAKCCMGQF